MNEYATIEMIATADCDIVLMETPFIYFSYLILAAKRGIDNEMETKEWLKDDDMRRRWKDAIDAIGEEFNNAAGRFNKRNETV